jgi:hypothetical protein
VKTFRSFTIDAGLAAPLAMVFIEGNLDGGWYRDKKTESHTKPFEILPMYCFACEETEERRSASMWLGQSNNGQLYVSNIFPQGSPKLSPEEYNYITQDFLDRFVKPAKQVFSIKVDIVETECSLEDLVTRDIFNRLDTFSVAANKSSISHPLDQKRWNAFIVETHKNNVEIETSVLEAWLVKDGWPENLASKLVSQYESGRELLAYYEKGHI